MAFLATRISREMEVQMDKASPCENPFHMVNPFSSRFYVSPWASMSATTIPLGLSSAHGGLGLCGSSKRGRVGIAMEFMFSKILTPSDVGKLNRLLIPRQSAEKYFPKLSKVKIGNDPILTFEDSTGLVWNFRFSLWRSSNTYVLTKGWPNFVKEKKLHNGDIVSFYRSNGNPAGTNHIFIHIEPHVGISYVPHQSTTPMFPPSSLLNIKWHGEGIGFGSDFIFEQKWKALCFGSGGLMPPITPMPQPTMFPESMSLGSSIERSEKRLRLFGVDIDVPHASGDGSCNGWANSVA